MKLSATLFAIAALCAHTVSAHYRFTKLIVNGQTTGEYQYVRRNSNHNSPVGVTDSTLGCNAGAQSGGNTQTATVAAGSQVGFEMDQGIFHVGPLLVYMAKVDNLATATGRDGWFKIYEIGPTFNGGLKWPTDNQSRFTFNIPSSIQAGDYLLRIEHIALHSQPSQHYPACAHLRVTGGGSARPATVSIPGAYSARDPGIGLNIYYPIPTSYTMPGPAVFRG